MKYKTFNKQGSLLEFKYTDRSLSILRNGEVWGCPQGHHFVIALLNDIEKYRKEIVELRGKAHLSCPKCNEDCISWVAEGTPCNLNWTI